MQEWGKNLLLWPVGKKNSSLILSVFSSPQFIIHANDVGGIAGQVPPQVISLQPWESSPVLTLPSGGITFSDVFNISADSAITLPCNLLKIAFSLNCLLCLKWSLIEVNLLHFPCLEVSGNKYSEYLWLVETTNISLSQGLEDLLFANEAMSHKDKF